MQLNGFHQRKSFDNIVNAIDLGVDLPKLVFKEGWWQFSFFPSDRMFSQDFPNVIKEFLRLEKAKVCCLLNVGETKKFDFESATAIYLDEGTTESEYGDRHREGGPALGWLYGVDTYACSSDVGSWCFYCERDNDVAVIGLHRSIESAHFDSILKKLDVVSCEDLGGQANETFAIFPFNQLTSAWRGELATNYNTL